MAEIMLVGNPRRRGKKGRRRKMSALQRKYFGGGKRHSNPKRRRRRRHAATGYTVGRAKIRRRKLNPSYRRSRRRRNPSLRGIGSGAVPMIKAGLVGATGALGLDLLWGQTAKFLPASLAGSALAQYAAKLIGAIAVGYIGGKFILKGRGRELAVGASTVVLHDALKAQIQTSFPSVPLGEYLTYAPTVGTMPRAGAFMDTGMGQYLNGLPDQNDAMSPVDGQDESGMYVQDGLNGVY